MAPDKIYINGDAASDLVYSPGEDDSKEEYIRKDALLEWLTLRVNEAKLEVLGCSNMNASGKYLAFQEVIDKIKEL